MWIFRGGDPRTPSFYFHYHQTRAGDVAAAFLDGYQGVVQTDGYGAYDFLDLKEDISLIGCWAHASRYEKLAQMGSWRHKINYMVLNNSQQMIIFITIPTA
jgi:hypothetical protein